MQVVRMARRTVVSPLPVIVTPPSGIQQKLGPLTFGNFIPGSFQPIREETELVEAKVVKHDPARKRITRRPEDSQFPRRL